MKLIVSVLLGGRIYAVYVHVEVFMIIVNYVYELMHVGMYRSIYGVIKYIYTSY